MNETKKAIFDSALREFSTNGYTGATMDDIALGAKVAKGTLYYHFKSKEEIFKFIITEGIQLIMEITKENADAETDALAKLRAVCMVQIQLLYEKKDFLKVVMSQLWGQEIRHIEMRETIRKYLDLLEKYMRNAMEQGIIKQGDTHFMAYAFLGTLCSTAVYELMNENIDEMDVVVDKMLGYVLRGIQKE